MTRRSTGPHPGLDSRQDRRLDGVAAGFERGERAWTVVIDHDPAQRRDRREAQGARATEVESPDGLVDHGQVILRPVGRGGEQDLDVGVAEQGP